MKAIGGYFELSSAAGKGHLHSRALALNTGRGAFEYILRTRAVSQVWLPYYICDCMLEPLQRLRLLFRRYSLDNQLYPILPETLAADDVLVYVNYFGLCDHHVKTLSDLYPNNLVVDNSQAFFAPAVPDVDTFYSARKMFGVPDGAYLYCRRRLSEQLEQDVSWSRCNHLLQRLELGPEAGFAAYQRNEDYLRGVGLKTMSSLTSRFLGSIEYDGVAAVRKRNFAYLHRHLQGSNSWRFTHLSEASGVPLCYPLLTSHGTAVKQTLVSKRIYTPTYWLSILDTLPADSQWERELVQNLVCLPVDQRYEEDDMNRIIKELTAIG